ncbi:MAG: hypothetical protein RLZZ137_1737, partial [Cyanobacteriota bacterium]
SKRQGGAGLAELRGQGLDQAAVIGRLAASLALVPAGSCLTAAELQQQLTLPRLQHQLREPIKP